MSSATPVDPKLTSGGVQCWSPHNFLFVALAFLYAFLLPIANAMKCLRKTKVVNFEHNHSCGRQMWINSIASSIASLWSFNDYEAIWSWVQGHFPKCFWGSCSRYMDSKNKQQLKTFVAKALLWRIAHTSLLLIHNLEDKMWR